MDDHEKDAFVRKHGKEEYKRHLPQQEAISPTSSTKSPTQSLQRSQVKEFDSPDPSGYRGHVSTPTSPTQVELPTRLPEVNKVTVAPITDSMRFSSRPDPDDINPSDQSAQATAAQSSLAQPKSIDLNLQNQNIQVLQSPDQPRPIDLGLSPRHGPAKQSPLVTHQSPP